ncbi:MAG: HAMP domain-containing histidine kinase [Clostridiales bacterium]|nr:HAMP domain-containing histidine kinase [Clostridiales bacterium]
MRRSSLRVWFLLVSTIVAVFIVGGLLLATFAVLGDALTAVAREAAAKNAAVMTGAVSAMAAEAQIDAAAEGLEGEALQREATRRLLSGLSELLDEGRGDEIEVALYDANLSLLWSSGDRAVTADDIRRRQSRHLGQQTESVAREGSALGVLIGDARIAVHTVHAPLYLPDGSRGVMDVTYLPWAEESVINTVALPIAALGIAGMVMMVLMIQMGIGWVLRLIEELRLAAESIDSGRLDVELPVVGPREMVELGNALNALIARLRYRAATQTRFVADASHELATPVAGIRGYTNILRAWSADDADVRDEAVEAIDRESRRMARLCGDLLSLVRSEQVTDFAITSFDVVQVAREVMAGAITRYQDKGVHYEGPPEVELPILAEPSRFEDALSVLVDNAFKYTPEGGTVTLDCWAEEGFVVARVSDTGIGISADELPNVFERFYRSDVSRSKSTGGFGLGLPIAKAAIESLGGTISVESVEGEGSTFTIVVPDFPPDDDTRGPG